MGIYRRSALRYALRIVVCGCVFCSIWGPTGGSISAQPVVPAKDVISMRSAIRTLPDDLRRPAVGTFDVVALRVEFQPDTTRFTSGDGTFDGPLYEGLEPAIDPLPHDAGYFQAHLDFLEDYVARVSDGIAEVRSHLVPEIVRLEEQMRAYAPTGPNSDSDDELRKLAAMIEEAWTMATEQSSFDMTAFDPSRTVLVLFHAGVGRDIELIGTTLDKTPEDLPSLFFDEEALARLLGTEAITFNGFPVEHTLVLPRTETRRAMDFIADEPFLLELSTNGLLAASFFNYLGMPDLFDTESGESAIGPFGLMDTQGIFAYRGLFPPEPMAWTKLFLGWTDPMNLEADALEPTSLRAVSLPGVSESARAIVSDAEYFMIENRHRDPEGDGLTMRIWKDGEIVEQHVENGDADFNSEVVDGYVGGVVVGVDNYDWALPGGVDEDDNELNGGILIWHIDERRLRSGLAGNTVNVGAETRAVDLEEADGAQDIGYPSAGPFGPQAELGSPFDFYYEGNPVRVLLAGGREVRLYENRFGPETFPSSVTNGGGPSFILIEDFSEPAAEMSFVYRQVEEGGIEPLPVPLMEQSGRSFTGGSFIACTTECPTTVYSALLDSVIFVGEPGAAISSTAPPAIGQEVVTFEQEDGRSRFVVRTTSESSSLSPVHVIDLPEELGLLTPISPIVITNARGERSYNVILRGDERTVVVEASTTGVSVRAEADGGEPVSIAARTSDVGAELVVVGRQGVAGAETSWSYSIPADAHVGQAVFGRDEGGIVGAVPITSTGELLMLAADGSVTQIDTQAAAAPFTTTSGGTLGAYPLVADLDGDHRLDVLASYGSMLLAFTQSGALVSRFPIHLAAGIVGQPLLADFGDSPGVIVASTDGYVYAFNISGRLRPVTGFPLEVGASVSATPALSADGTLTAISENGHLKAWRIPGITSVRWGRMFGSEDNAGFIELAPGEPGPPDETRTLIVGDETYNWPNPIRNGSTHLRITTRRDARVSIRIIDGAGQLVDDVDMGIVRAGIPSEVKWQTDAESGLYFARLTAKTDDGEEDTSLVKMAVIR